MTSGWVQHASSTHQGCCLVGAIHKVCPYGPERDAVIKELYDRLGETSAEVSALHGVHFQRMRLIRFNDDPSTTKGDVLKLLQ